MRRLSRREILAAAVVSKAVAARPKGYLVDSLHLFSDDQQRFPYHPNATYRPSPKTVETYSEFVREVKIDHTVIIHSEVYQDDHRYLGTLSNTSLARLLQGDLFVRSDRSKDSGAHRGTGSLVTWTDRRDSHPRVPLAPNLADHNRPDATATCARPA
jgi:hypothetical protein